MGLQRHVNLLKDPNKVKRRRAIVHIRRVLDELIEKVDDEENENAKVGRKMVVKKLFYETLSHNIVEAIQDESEKPREISVGIVADVVPFLDLGEEKDGNTLYTHILTKIHDQIAKFPTKEPSEEVRLAMLNLTITMSKEAPGLILDELDHLSSIASACCRDQFPEVKIAVKSLIACVGSRVLVPGVMDATKAEQVAEQLAKSLVPNLKHQRFKVRAATLRGLSQIVESRGKVEQWLREALPQVAKLTLDRSGSVRLLMVQTVHIWLKNLKFENRDWPKFLLILLAGVSDSDLACNEAARKLMEDLGRSKFDMCVDDKTGKNDSKDGIKQQQNTQSVSEGSRRLCLECLGELVKPSILQLSSWVNEDRVQAAGNLHCLVVLAREGMVDYLEVILQAMVKHVKDIEDVIYPKLCATLTQIGALPIESWLEIVFKALKTTAEGGHSTWLLILTNLLKGAEKEEIKKSVKGLAKVLSKKAICLSDDMPTRFFARSAISCILGAFEVESLDKEAPQVPVSTIFWALIQLHSKVESRQEFEGVEAVVRELNAKSQQVSESKKQSQSQEDMAIYSTEFMHVFSKIVGKTQDAIKKIDWSRETEESRLITTLLKRSAHVIHHHLHVVIPLMISACNDVENAPAVRMSILSLLLQLVEQSDSAAAKDSEKYTSDLIEGVILPNMVWRNGDTAETIRLTAIRILDQLLRKATQSDRKMISGLCYRRLETLETCLDDSDVRIRLKMASVFGYILGSQDGQFDELSLKKLYPKLIDRLDDSDDRVRISMARTLLTLVKFSFPPMEEFDHNGQAFRYIVKHTLIHLDDSNEKVGRAMFVFLQNIKSYNTEVFIELVQRARTRHTTPERCDALLKAVEMKSGMDTSSGASPEAKIS
eukprot:CAMPEP_0197520428 /NCGR_PEP_ID=MMETSP1318-20131121/5777_1 /TAXON_ID=552666 /ORGANISM="Partenskyella glossopodia, Strain RCC365" /LENGTH=882 /DNA_ID=CAMNT_0043071989 /DNA_START=86 /DNA_END=2734 /DNA_ORIENTATION=+